MNRYCSEEYTIAATANAKADVELNKNLTPHLIEINEGIIELKSLIRSERLAGATVDVRQSIMVEMMKFANEIRFKLRVTENSDVPSTFIGAATDFEYERSDYLQGENLNFHLATLTYDIESVSSVIDRHVKLGQRVADELSLFKDQLENHREIIQKALDLFN